MSDQQETKKPTDTVETGFNDAELEDIMSEIESLEGDYEEGSAEHTPEEDLSQALGIVEETEEASEPEGSVSEEPQIAEEEVVAESEPEVSVEDPVENVTTSQTHESQQQPQAEVVPINSAHKPKTKVAATSPVDATQTSMDFQVSGQMNLKLNFAVGGNNVTLSISEGSGLVIEMGGGIKFTVPIQSDSARERKAS